MKKHGIERIKKLIELVHIIYTLELRVKMKWYEYIYFFFTNSNKIERVYKELKSLWIGKEKIIEEIRDLDYNEQIEIIRLVKEKFGVSQNAIEIVEELVIGVNALLGAWAKIQDDLNKCKAK